MLPSGENASPSKPRSPPVLIVFEMSTIGSLTAAFAGLNTRTRPPRSATHISRRPARVAIAIGAFIVATRRRLMPICASGTGGGAVGGGGGGGGGAAVVAGAAAVAGADDAGVSVVAVAAVVEVEVLVEVLVEAVLAVAVEADDFADPLPSLQAAARSTATTMTPGTAVLSLTTGHHTGAPTLVVIRACVGG